MENKLTRGILIKTEFGFKLNDLDNVYIASEQTGKLSLKNCQAIELGYDLDDKISEHLEKNHIEASTKRVQVIKELILELLGDKKFSEDDLLKAFTVGVFTESEKSNHTKEYEELLKSIQPNEWEVDIEMEQDFSNRSCNTCCFGTEGFCELQKKKCVSKSGNENHKDWWASRLDDESDSEIYKPKLDENGCLILKPKKK